MSASNKPDYADSDRGWWLGEGAEQCEFCEQAVHAEALADCARCDRGVCLVCRVYETHTGPILCPECAEEALEEEG